ncbi:RNA polymerase sigma factor [Spirosoma taeanense]|uniref:RNA polymerase sigma factor n=1 Tax=Spirosoma taeanense TaxID=2735870 RepID=A0A6M5Y2T4_9BACT|nr:RNA polymerase sigma factor [Spirosoma taeanense]QJW88109.1 RNA polymerase sigma factor [Spirosoma taeanense]
MQTFTDEQLVNLYLETQENEYFKLLYERYSDKVHRKCYSFTKDSFRADDLTQDIFLRLLIKLRSYKQQARFSTWLYSITHNHCTDQVRTPSRRYEVVTGADWDRLDTQSDDGLAERAEAEDLQIQRAMTRLTPDEQHMLRMKYQEEATIKDIAGHHSITESAVKMRLKRSRDRLRHYYWKSNAEDLLYA